jgi:hypothetical protein
MRVVGSQRWISRRIPSQVSRTVWLRRRSARDQSRPTRKQNVVSAGLFIGTPQYCRCPKITRRRHAPTPR